MKKLKTVQRVCAIISILVIAAGLVCYFLAGFAPSKEFNGARVFTSDVSTDADTAAIDLKKLGSELSDAAGKTVTAAFVTNYSSGSKVIEITSVPLSYELDSSKLLGVLTSNYADLAVTELTPTLLAPVYGRSAVAAFGLVVLCGLVAAFLAGLFVLGARDGLHILLLALHDVLLVFAVSVLARVANFQLIVGAVLLTLLLSAAANIRRYAALDRLFQRSKDAAESAQKELREDREYSIGVGVFAVLAAAAFVVTGLVSHFAILCWLGAAIGAAVACALYSSLCLAPAFWANAQNK